MTMSTQTVAERISGQPGTWKDLPLYQTLPDEPHPLYLASLQGDMHKIPELAERLRPAEKNRQ
jgi:hypothetical protein